MERLIARAEILTQADHQMPAGPEGVVYATYADGTRELIFEFDAFDYGGGELPFTEGDFRGLTAEEARNRYAPWALMPLDSYTGRITLGVGGLSGREDSDEGEIPF